MLKNNSEFFQRFFKVKKTWIE